MAVENDERFNFYDFNQRKSVEFALWPNLYPFTSCCETNLDGREYILSSKIVYMTKINSQIAD